MTSYQPNNSEFGATYRFWKRDPKLALASLTMNQLEEYASCADSILDTPVYADDAKMLEFRKDLEDAQRDLLEYEREGDH